MKLCVVEHEFHLLLLCAQRKMKRSFKKGKDFLNKFSSSSSTSSTSNHADAAGGQDAAAAGGPALGGSKSQGRSSICTYVRQN